MRIVYAALFIGFALPAAAAAQTRTNPPTLDFTCHGYNEAQRGTRAYNCIPKPEQQHLMTTFVPSPGSACDEGQVNEFPPGRIVFQIRCQDSGDGPTRPVWSKEGTGPAYFGKPLSVVRVRITSKFSGRAGNFIVRCAAPRQSLIVNELIGSSFGNDGTVGVYRMADCNEVEVDTEQTAHWTFREERALTAFTPARSWANVAGAGSGLQAEALAALATAVEAERAAR